MKFLAVLLLLAGCAGAPCTDPEPDTACKILGGAAQIGLSLLGGGGR